MGEGREKTSKTGRGRETAEADKVKVAPGVTVGSLRRFRATLIGPTQGLLKQAGERGAMWVGGELERMDELRGRGAAGVCHHGELE